MPTSPQCWHRRWMVPSGSSSATSMPRVSTLNRTSRYATMPLHFLHRAAQYNLSVITNPRLRLLTRGGQIHNYGSASLVLLDFENRGLPQGQQTLIRAALSLVTGEAPCLPVTFNLGACSAGVCTLSNNQACGTARSSLQDTAPAVDLLTGDFVTLE
jgi:hypothetical protein